MSERQPCWEIGWTILLDIHGTDAGMHDRRKSDGERPKADDRERTRLVFRHVNEMGFGVNSWIFVFQNMSSSWNMLEFERMANPFAAS